MENVHCNFQEEKEGRFWKLCVGELGIDPQLES